MSSRDRPANVNTFVRTDASRFPVGNAIATGHSLLLGFGLEGVATAAERNALIACASSCRIATCLARCYNNHCTHVASSAPLPVRSLTPKTQIKSKQIVLIRAKEEMHATQTLWLRDQGQAGKTRLL